jgi:DNA-binding CsgD family transcriptional regulator
MPQRDERREAQELREAGRSPAEIRQRALEIVCRVAEADSALCYSLAEVGGALAISSWQCTGDEVNRRRARDFASAPYRSELKDPRRPKPHELRGFLESGALWPREVFEQSPLYRTTFLPSNLEDQLRLLVFEGPRFVAWVGALRSRGAPRFGAPERRRLAPLVPALRAAFSGALALEREGLPDEPAYFVARAGGRLDHASAAARPWLSRPGFREALSAFVRGYDAGGPAAPPALLAGAEASLTHLDTLGAARYLVRVTPARLPSLGPEFSLTPAQREVAGYAAGGATVAEIARAVGAGVNTVRAHLREIYQRLEVSSRLELERALRAKRPKAP